MAMERKPRASRSSSADDSNEITLWKRILAELASLDETRKDDESLLSTINEKHGGIGDVAPQGMVSKLAGLYKKGIENAEKEKNTIATILEHLDVLLALRNNPDNSIEIKRKKRKNEPEELLRPSNTKKLKAENNKIPVNSLVAAKIQTPNKKDKDSGEWILATVLNWSDEKKKYEVQDYEPDDSGKQLRYTLPSKYIIQIQPQQEAPEIKAGEDVLALYPGTTCFYKATVTVPPSKNKDQRSFKVRFEDDNNEQKEVERKYVLDMPKTK